MSFGGAIKPIIYGIIIAMILFVIYYIRAYSNRESDRRLIFLIQNHFKIHKGGITELLPFSPEDISVRTNDVTILKREGDKLTVKLKYKTPSDEKKEVTLTYTIKSSNCGQLDPLCINTW